MTSRLIKPALFRRCEAYVDERIESSRNAIAAAQAAANEETKSSSGDKYETGRAMMQLEIEKNGEQLLQAMKLKTALDRIPKDSSPTKVQPGSLVVTDRETFYIAISLGRITLKEKTYVVIAPDAPLGSALMGSVAGETVRFRNERYVIHDVQ